LNKEKKNEALLIQEQSEAQIKVEANPVGYLLGKV
jgi:hypothetical protein